MADQQNTRLIPLTQGKFAIVDVEDFEFISQWKWRVNNKRHNCSYAERTIVINEHKTCIAMHRLIMDAPYKLDVDHINHDGLDNRKSNLRICTRSENLRNSRGRKRSYTKYKGIGFSKDKNKWRSFIRINNKMVHLGTFEREIEAAKAYNNAAIQHFGEFACLNVIEEVQAEHSNSP